MLFPDGIQHTISYMIWGDRYVLFFGHMLVVAYKHIHIIYNSRNPDLNSALETIESSQMKGWSPRGAQNRWKRVKMEVRCVLNSKNPLCEQYCAFTGRLKKYTRKEAMQILVNLGGLSECGVTKKTRFLILGTQVKEGKSYKQLKAEKNAENGQNIEIITENIFYNMLALDESEQICMDGWCF